MSLVINNNLMAANTARTLNQHYGRLQTSTQRLSSGLRINSAADDAAGLAIRELQRADIAALQQGARNANDAISMIQVADGALGIIDEKLIRMKELAEQAATGTYDSTQRLMIESEYQAMASEITRIANATDFNGTKLLDGTLDGDHDGSGLVSKGEMKIHFGTGNDSAEDYYYIHIGECTSQAFGLGNASTWEDVQQRGMAAFKQSLQQQIKNDQTLTSAEKGQLLASIDEMAKNVEGAINNAVDPTQAYKLWGLPDDPDMTAYENAIFDVYKQGNAGAAGTVQNDIELAKQDTANWAGAEDSVIWKSYQDLGGVAQNINDAKTGDQETWEKAKAAAQGADEGFLKDGKKWVGSSDLMERYLAAATKAANAAATAEPAAGAADKILASINLAIDAARDPNLSIDDQGGAAAITAYQDKLIAAAVQAAKDNGFTDADATALETALKGITTGVPTAPAAGGTALTDTDFDTWVTAIKTEINNQTTAAETAAKASAVADATAEGINEFWDSLRTTEKQKLQYAWGQAAIYNLANADMSTTPPDYGLDFDIKEYAALAGLEDGSTASAVAEKILAKALEDMHAKVGNMDFAGFTIETQEDAQHALDAINNAIVEKDKIRAHLGATQNRLENTISNLNIQAENLQAAESRISDVDVATEMTQFVRNQILTQSAVAMLGQANSLPQMAMQLIGG